MNWRLKLTQISRFHLLIWMMSLVVSPLVIADSTINQAANLSEALTEGNFKADFKLRYENVNQDGKRDDAKAFTLRSLIGYQTKPFHNFSINAEIYGVSPVSQDYNDLKKGTPLLSRTKYPVVADPEDYDFHQIYLQWSNAVNTLKLGRQGMVLDNWRFVGDVRFRQNWQVFNGLSFVNKSLSNTEISLAHYEQVKQITTKIQDADIEIANVKYAITPTTRINGYGYFINWNGETLKASSTKTYGLRLHGSQKVDDKWSVLYTVEYAKQDDYKDGSDLIDNYYYLIGVGLGYNDWFVRLDQEKLSGNSDNKAFQTPLGTNHLFQGWADVFLTTPDQGIEDTMIIAGGKFMGAKVKAEYHWINSDRNFAKVGGGTADQYGAEFDLGVYYNFTKQISGSIEYANFKEEDKYVSTTKQKRDVERFWITAMYHF